jgi:phospholipase C
MRKATWLVLSAGFLALATPAACVSDPPADMGVPAPVDASLVDVSEDADQRPPTPATWDRQVVRPDDKTAADKRFSCAFKRGDMPAETLGTSYPVDRDIPIKNVVVLMMENRSFDHYFGKLAAYAKRTDIESPDAATTNPLPDGGTVPFQHAEKLCFLDTNHEWNGVHKQVNGGKMDGFFQTNDGWSELRPGMSSEFHSGARALWYYDERDIPYYYALANTFSIADHYHCSLQGPTWPNRMFLYAATSFGMTFNSLPDTSKFPYPASEASVLDELEKRHTTWNLYSDALTGPALVHPLLAVRWGERQVVRRVDDFLTQAQNGTMPEVSFVDPRLLPPDRDDEHPPSSPQLGQRFVAKVIKAIMQSPQWKDTVLFLTYDEHGGLYDHVVPPPACPPDDIPLKFDEDHVPEPGALDHLGVRVPLIVVSPYAKRAHVSHVTYDHTSITRFIETKFKLPALSRRDANADPLMDMFDFQNPPFMTPPALPEASVNQAEQDYCKQLFNN